MKSKLSIALNFFLRLIVTTGTILGLQNIIPSVIHIQTVTSGYAISESEYVREQLWGLIMPFVTVIVLYIMGAWCIRSLEVKNEK
jgi:uncharacterized membrane protein (UPF0136 family)